MTEVLNEKPEEQHQVGAIVFKHDPATDKFNLEVYGYFDGLEEDLKHMYALLIRGAVDLLARTPESVLDAGEEAFERDRRDDVTNLSMHRATRH